MTVFESLQQAEFEINNAMQESEDTHIVAHLDIALDALNNVVTQLIPQSMLDAGALRDMQFLGAEALDADVLPDLSLLGGSLADRPQPPALFVLPPMASRAGRAGSC